MLKQSSEFNRNKIESLTQTQIFKSLNLNLCKLIVQIFDISILEYLIYDSLLQIDRNKSTWQRLNCRCYLSTNK